MDPYQERVVTEKRELDEKLEKLIAFIAHNPAFQSLELADRQLLIYQRRIMEEYSLILAKRIARFA